MLYIHVLILVPETSDGTIVPKEPNPTVPDDLLKEVSKWTSEGVTEDDVIDRLQCRTVPSGYTFSSWTKGIFCGNIVTCMSVSICYVHVRV